MKSNQIIDVTKKNIKRNRFLAISTILVTSIVILISSFFISLGIIAQKGNEFYEKQAQVIVFFKRDTAEQDILAMKEKWNDETLVESITYTSQEKALADYKETFADNPDLLATVTTSSLPPSLEIRAKSVDALMTMIEQVNQEKEVNASIDDVMYIKELVNNLGTISNIIRISSLILIIGLLVVAFFLIRVAIGFNINSHKEEIKVMNLVGSSKDFIAKPYILEGTSYGALGGLIAATIIIVPFYIFLSYMMRNIEFSYLLNQLLKNWDLLYIQPVNISFLLLYYLVHIVFGGLIGLFSSLNAVKKYLD